MNYSKSVSKNPRELGLQFCYNTFQLLLCKLKREKIYLEKILKLSYTKIPPSLQINLQRLRKKIPKVEYLFTFSTVANCKIQIALNVFNIFGLKVEFV